MTNEIWVARNGSIFTERTYKTITEYKTSYHSAKTIAFNVGDKIAEHIVELHNAQVKELK